MDIKDRTNLKKANVKVNKSMNEAIVIASEQVEDQVKEMNENNLAMEQMPSSEDKPSPSQPMDGADYDTDSDDYSDNDEDYGDEGRVYKDMCREGIIEE
jgi:hypothetical protein